MVTRGISLALQRIRLELSPQPRANFLPRQQTLAVCAMMPTRVLQATGTGRVLVKDLFDAGQTWAGTASPQTLAYQRIT